MNFPKSHIFLWNLSYFITLDAFSYCLFCKLFTILKNLHSLFFISIESIVYGLVFVFGLIWILFLTLLDHATLVDDRSLQSCARQGSHGNAIVVFHLRFSFWSRQRLFTRERSDCVPILFCVQTGAQLFH